MEGSEIRESHLARTIPRVQDAYSLRCMPQVHGAFGLSTIAKVFCSSNPRRPLIIRLSLKMAM